MTKFKRQRNIIAALCMTIFGCSSVSDFEFSSPCYGPDKVIWPKHENMNGCWRLVAYDGYGYLLDKPGEISCSQGVRCVVVLPTEDLWVVGIGKVKSIAYDVDCSETC